MVEVKALLISTITSLQAYQRKEGSQRKGNTREDSTRRGDGEGER
jgi:hypothetical protein